MYVTQRLVFNFAFLGTDDSFWHEETWIIRNWRQSRIADIYRADVPGYARNAFFHAYAKLIGKIAVIASFGSGLNATQRDSNEVIPCISYQRGRQRALLPRLLAFITLHSRGLRRAKFSRQTERESERARAEHGREQPKRCDHVAIARWQKHCQCHCDCRPTWSRGNFTSRSSLDSFRLSFSFFSSLPFFSLYLASLSGLSNSPQGRQRWRRFLARARVWRQDDCQKTRKERVSLRFCERKRDRFRLGAQGPDDSFARSSIRSSCKVSRKSFPF